MKTMVTLKKLRWAIFPALAIPAVFALSAFSNGGNTYAVCHIPPGNPDNCHEIRVSANAVQDHLNHGDKLFCDDENVLGEYLNMTSEQQIIKRFKRRN